MCILTPQSKPNSVSIVLIPANSVCILAILSTCCRFDKRKAGITRCRVRGGHRSVPARATTAQNRSFVSNPPAFHVEFCLILILILDQDTVWYPFEIRLRVFCLNFVSFGCFPCLILVHSGVIYPDSVSIHWIVSRSGQILLLRGAFFGFLPQSRLR